MKADGYGLGAGRVVPALHAAGCCRFFVATVDEGVEVRAALPQDAPTADTADTADIYVLDGMMGAGTEALFDRARLVPVLNTPDDVERWGRHARAEGGRRAMIAVDTGMCRLGLSPAEVEALADDPAALDGIAIDYVMSHLACAEDRDHPLNEEQRLKFDELRGRLPPAKASFANSGGIFLGPPYHYDLVRPGAALYGVSRAVGAPEPMQQAVVLKAKILQVRVVDTDSTVGYGASRRVASGARLATVAAGYADGYLRSLSNRGHGYIGDVRVPVVGRVSMDLIVFDISDVPADAVRPGDDIDLINDRQTVDDLAEEAGTIGYEILTSLGARYRRRYTGGPGGSSGGGAA